MLEYQESSVQQIRCIVLNGSNHALSMKIRARTKKAGLKNRGESD